MYSDCFKVYIVGFLSGLLYRTMVYMLFPNNVTDVENRIAFRTIWCIFRLQQLKKDIVTRFGSTKRRKEDPQDPKIPIFINQYLKLLPWTVIYHQSNGLSLQGECAFKALQDILGDIAKDLDGFVCCDYKVSDESTIYRMALTNKTVYNGQLNAWPFGQYTAITNGTHSTEAGNLTARPGIIQAKVISPLSVGYDVTPYFVSLEGPKNTFSDMTGISIDKLLLDSPIPKELICDSTILLQNIRGTITISTEMLINEAHERLCVVGNE